MGACHGPQVDQRAFGAFNERGGVTSCCSSGGGSLLGGACSSALGCKFQDIDLDLSSPVKDNDSFGEVLQGFDGCSKTSRAGRAPATTTPAFTPRGSYAIRSSDGEVEVGGKIGGDGPRISGRATEAADRTAARDPATDKANRGGAEEGGSENWHGPGVLSWPDGRRYVGQFWHGAFDGEATMVWPDGRRYMGQYQQNKKHGDGSFLWPDGRQYEGQWLNGQRHGIGSYTNARGEQRLGRWAEDRPVSWEGKFTKTKKVLLGETTPPSDKEGSSAKRAGRGPGKVEQTTSLPATPPQPNNKEKVSPVKRNAAELMGKLGGA